MSASGITVTTVMGKSKPLPDHIAPERVVGLDDEFRIVVNDHEGDDPAEFYFGLTLCCNAYDKGVEDGIVCRACYDDRDTGSYLFRNSDGTYSGLDPARTIR